MIEARRGEAPYLEVIEPLTAETVGPLIPRANRELRALGGTSVSAQIPYDPAVTLGQDVSVCVESGEIVTGVVSYVEQIMRDGQAVTAVKLLL